MSSSSCNGDFRRASDDAARLGHPSYIWRAGQARRLALVRQWVGLEGARILDVGCGVGMYTGQFRRFSDRVVGVEVDLPVARQAASRLPGIILASAAALPFAAGSFDVVFSHEVIEHIADDRAAAREMVRVVAPAGRIVLFCPNRLYPFETHGHYWRGRYHFGNTPLINWLPDPLRNRLAPHVRAYTAAGLRALFLNADPKGLERPFGSGAAVRVVHHSVIYPGFDNVSARRPALGRVLRQVLYALEHSPLQWFGLSHFLMLEKVTHGDYEAICTTIC
jgi:SAM-dependent methyltransferase